MKLTPALVVLGLLSGCAHQVPKEALPVERSDAADGIERDAGSRAELLLRAFGLVGVQYQFGGHSPDTGFDCSGLVQYLFSEVLGLALPRRAQDMSRIGSAVRHHELHPGDLVFFDTLREPFSHVGIYLGDHRFIHAPSSGGQVEVVFMTDRYWHRRYNGARRIGF
ncbi:MAG: C40 family peptidase [Betaproteobacteria bacterium]|nr:C40 family peptidase [Betaproteobacteria bacterium]